MNITSQKSLMDIEEVTTEEVVYCDDNFKRA
jgi:hypothetical protein